ncbi:MAG: CDP-alcohol phosphatidyltransferase family protein [Clostridiaceae bacterium]|nr:CDP-alcohol phosphatidyltransferase family protein [Clostridiaceae bacterium]
MKLREQTALIGYYNPSVILTYIGLASSVAGIFLAVEGFFTEAFLCLLVSGVCDMFDGRIARMITRTDDAKCFGIQIDSLCDLVCFGVFPAILAWNLGVKGIVGISILALYILAAVIRLGYFNVSESKRQAETTELRHFYQGLPVTSVAVLLPIIYLAFFRLQSFLPIAFYTAMTAISLLFVLNIRIPKPSGRLLFTALAFGAALACLLIGFGG